MKGTQKPRLVGWVFVACLAVGPLLVSTSVGLASEMGAVAAAQVELESYRDYLDNQLFTHDGDDRSLYGPEHDPAQANIAAIMTGFGLTVTLEPFDYGGNTYYNVVGTKLGTVDETVEYVVGAHYDSVNYSDPWLGAPGADDNASGVALVLEAARVITQYESDYTIRFVAFDREEQGLLGAWAFALDHIGDNIQGVVVADMVAYNLGADAVDIEVTRSESAPIQNALADAVSMYGEGLNRGVQFGGSSDHAPFEQVGFQACLIIERWGNPCWHYGCDSVDSPDYIDYEFAVKSVRSVTGFLVDQAGVQVDIPDGDFTGDGNVDMADYAEFEACFAGSGTPVDPPCDFFDFNGDGDVDCNDYLVFKAVWTGPGEAPVFWGCVFPAPIANGESGRALAVTPPEHGLPLALLVTGDITDPNVSCMTQAPGERHYVQADGRLGATAYFQTYDQWGTVIVNGDEIVPDTQYRVWCDYGESGLSTIGDAAVTSKWGDVVGDFYAGQWTPSNGTVDFNDISSVVDAFRSSPTAPPVSWADLVGASGSECNPDLAIDFLDIGAVVEAFKGYDFWETTSCPVPCD